MRKEKYKNPTAGLTLEQVEDLLADTLSRMPHGYRLPYMQWFEDDFRGSEGVEEMASLERLMYRQLLAKAWASKDAPYLPSNEDKLKRLCDSPNDELWEAHRENVLAMFKESKFEGKMFHPRQMLDYTIQLSKVVINTENGGKGGRPKTETKPTANPTETERLILANPDQTETKPIKNQNENQNKNQKLESELDLEPSTTEPQETELLETKDEDSDMKVWKQIQILSEQILGVRAENYAKEEVDMLTVATSSGQVVREFTEWAQANQGDDFRGRPVSTWLRTRGNTVQAQMKQAADDPVVLNLVRELAYRSDNQVVFDNKAKAGLAKLVADGNTPDEIVSVFRTDFYPPISEDAFKLKFAAKTFVETADQLIYTARRKKAEKEAEVSAVDSARERMQREAESERAARQKAQEAESLLIESELPD